MNQVRIHDDYPSQIAHICVGGRTFHASVAGDAKSAECLETGDRATGETREECLRNLSLLLSAAFTRTTTPIGIIG